MVSSGVTAHPRILRLKQVQERVGLGRSTIYDRINPKSPRYDSSFPKPIKLGVSAVGWIEANITTWIESRMFGGCSG
nr:AlpA family transcriptional regulator [Pseudomonas frederiksbergensis]